jgi:hypothetical protein
MPTADEYQALPEATSLRRLATTPDQLGAALAGRPDSVLTRRPEPRSWAPTEIVCHLRDVEELFLVRFQTILAAADPKILAFAASPEDLAAWGIGGAVGHPLDPDRWAEERQYLRNDAGVALAAFHRRRGETLALLRGLSSAQWERGGIHPARGRLPMTAWVASLAAHDDNHLDQLLRALAGRP